MPLDPARVIDTRVGQGICSPGCTRIYGGTARTMRIRGLGGVPSSGVSAVALSVTAVNTQGAGYVTVYNSGLPLPATSNINYTAGEDTSLAATVELSAGGEIQVFVGGYTSTDLTVDVYGYFTASADGAQQFVALDPSKIVDTRSGLGTCTPSPCARRPDNSSFSTQVAGRGRIPVSGVGAVVLNLTSVNPGAVSGWLRANPTGSAASTLDVVVTPPGETTANQVTTRVGADGRIEIRNGVSTDVVIDVIGYYISTAPAPVTDTTTYTYDADGLRTSKTGGGVTTRFVWDRSGPLPLLLEERVGPSVNRYVYGPGGSPVADTLADGTVRYYHSDQIGSTRALTGPPVRRSPRSATTRTVRRCLRPAPPPPRSATSASTATTSQGSSTYEPATTTPTPANSSLETRSRP
jgi:hypothetical protein